MHTITPKQAGQAYDILIRHAGALDDPDERAAFVYHVSDPIDPAKEYRFVGSLGFGGKFRNNETRNDTPHITCYGEHLDAVRQLAIDEVNARLADLFPAPGVAIRRRGSL